MSKTGGRGVMDFRSQPWLYDEGRTIVFTVILLGVCPPPFFNNSALHSHSLLLFSFFLIKSGVLIVAGHVA